MRDRDTFKEKPRGNIYMRMDAKREIFWGAPMNPAKTQMLEGVRPYQFKCPSCGEWFDHTPELIEYHTTHADVAYAMLKIGMVYLEMRENKNNGGGEMPKIDESMLVPPRKVELLPFINAAVVGKKFGATLDNVYILTPHREITRKSDGTQFMAIDIQIGKKGEKYTLSLNKGNLRAIAAKHGSNSDNWVGQTITLVRSEARNPKTNQNVPSIKVE